MYIYSTTAITWATNTKQARHTVITGLSLDSPEVSPRSGLSDGGPPSSSEVSLLLEWRNKLWRRGWMLYCLTEKSSGCGSSRGRSGCGGCSSIGTLSGGDSLLLLLTLWWCCCCNHRRMAADRLRSAREGPSQTSSRALVSSTMVPAELPTRRHCTTTSERLRTRRAARPQGEGVGGGTDQSERAPDKYAQLIKRD